MSSTDRTASANSAGRIRWGVPKQQGHIKWVGGGGLKSAKPPLFGGIIIKWGGGGVTPLFLIKRPFHKVVTLPHSTRLFWRGTLHVDPLGPPGLFCFVPSPSTIDPKQTLNPKPLNPKPLNP